MLLKYLLSSLYALKSNLDTTKSDSHGEEARYAVALREPGLDKELFWNLGTTEQLDSNIPELNPMVADFKKKDSIDARLATVLNKPSTWTAL